MAKEKFSLKDALFNKQKIDYLAQLIANVSPEFLKENFVKDVMSKLLKLELLQRIIYIKEILYIYLPDDFEQALAIILKSLPKALDPSKSDDDFGDFIFAPFGLYVADYGCNAQYLENALQAIPELTQRFSMESTIRPFLKKYPKESFEYVKKWAQDSNYHVRRLASEGIRPNLPWSGKLDIGLKNIFMIYDRLFCDRTRYVVRSVANGMNDISKTHPQAVLEKLAEWKKSGKQSSAEMEFLISHALRSLIKKGHSETMAFLSYEKPDIHLKNFEVLTPSFALGQHLEFAFDIISNREQSLLIDYILYFCKSNGGFGQKTFRIKKTDICAGVLLKIQKKHPFRPMTTRKLYAGTHFLELQINGISFGKQSFEFCL